MPARRRGLLLVLSSPSGAGKTTLSRRLLATDDNITMSVSVTTRAPRDGEVDGKDYHFISVAEFERMDGAGELLESARVFDNYYGTPRQQVEAALAAGRDVLFDIDWQGTQQLGAEMKGDLVRIFVLPPSGMVLEERLRTRAKDPADVVARRMAKASDEISHWAEYDYVLVNDDLDTCEQAITEILHVERRKAQRQLGLVEFVRGLQAELAPNGKRP
jgi:guanylate kinase